MKRPMVRCLHFVFVLALVCAFVPMTTHSASAAEPGFLNVFKKNSDGQRLPNSCFTLYKNAGGGKRGQQVAFQCDQYDATPNDGKLVFLNLPAGSYVLGEYWAPIGYALAPDKTVTITAGQRTQVSVVDAKGGTTVIVSTVNPANTLIKGACYNIYRDDGVGNGVTNACDQTDGSLDGRTTLRGLRLGKYVLQELQAPSGYKLAANKRFSVTADGTTRLKITNQPYVSSQTVTIKKVDPNGNPVVGACFQLSYPISNPNAPGGVDVGGYAGLYACDWNDGAGDGKIKLYGVPAGNYLALETYTPSGYVTAPIKLFTKVTGTAKTVTITDKFGGSTLTVLTRNEQGGVLKGACFSVHRSIGVDHLHGVFIDAGCDTDDGSLDGAIHLTNLPGGTFELFQYQQIPGFTPVKRVFANLASNSTKTMTVVYKPVSSANAAEAATPTATPSATPTPELTTTPVATVTNEPTAVPTDTITMEPTAEPTEEPTEVVTAAPTDAPAATATAEPTVDATIDSPGDNAAATPEAMSQPEE